MPLSYIIDERRLFFMRKLLYHDNPVLRTLASLPVVYFEYINLCLQYAIKDPLCSRKYIRESVWNAFLTVYFSIFSIFVCILCVLHCAALVRNQ